MEFGFFRRKTSGTSLQNQADTSYQDEGARMFDPADLEMLKQRAPRDRASTTKSEFVNLFRSQLTSAHRQR